MKSNFMPAAFILCIFGAMCSTAQVVPGRTPAYRQRGHYSAAKSTASASRIIANATYYGNAGGAWQLSDSSSYTYSNGRGGELVPTITINGMLVNLHFDDGLNWSWDASAHIFKPYEHVTHTFDAKNNELTEVLQAWNGTAWINNTRYSHLLNAAEYDTLQTMEIWSTSANAWVGSRRYHYTFDATDTILLSDLQQVWQTSSGNWLNSTYTTYTYTANGDFSTLLTQQWNAGNNSWQNYSQLTYTYAAPNKILTSTSLNYDVPSSSWKNQRRTINYYNGSLQLTGTVNQTGSGSTWANQDSSSLSLLTAAGNPQLGEYYVWNSGWDHDYRITYTYTASDQFASSLEEVWNSGAYTNGNEVFATYDVSNRLVQEYTLTWSTNAWTATPSDWLANYYYETFDLGVAAPVAGLQVMMYPVPAHSSIHIGMTAATEVHHASLAIYNIQGALCGQWEDGVSGAYGKDISTVNLPAGIYHLLLSTERGRVSKTFTVEH